jgi:SAM-dependent methyltransferase
VTNIPTDYDRFDAIVGRNLLMHQADAVAVVRRLAQLVGPGGLMLFAEPVLMAPPLVAQDDRPLAASCMGWLVEAFQSAGLRTDFGLRLYATFIAAGLQNPTCPTRRVIFGGADAAGLALARRDRAEHAAGDRTARHRHGPGGRDRHARRSAGGRKRRGGQCPVRLPAGSSMGASAVSSRRRSSGTPG